MDMINGLHIPEYLAMEEQSADLLYGLIMALYGGFFCPFLILGQNGWLTLIGICLLALDVFVAIKVGRPIYRTLRYRWRVPEYLILFPLLPVPACAVGLVNSMAFGAIVLFGKNLFEP
jgi:hypothetical protein